ncbi:Hsp20/alpha crystallin family protein [Propionibacterium freudenreichii]|uniref:Hsp20/alpha crystallin family protein n=1 Tax=Propionibacterium freudenreichii TaxID=1744 RepID=UPI0021A54E1B|nr:Hsp20/alpha crystallin family protein [Propionibacterium freudenreichii]
MMLFDTFKELDRISSAFFSGFPEPALSSAPVNLYRQGDGYVLEADLPGFDPSSIDVSAEPGLLTIRADRDTSREDQGERWLVHERSSARVVRQLALGDEVDLDAVTADYRDGVLKITLPVRADALPRKVAVAVGSPAPVQQAIESAGTAEEVADPKAVPAHSVAS